MHRNRTGWGTGPWDDEPDHIDFVTAAGLPGIMHRNSMGAWCGYVAVPPGHPSHGKRDGEVDCDVHGGLTYANACQGSVCHVAAPGEPDDVWWLGFDCSHCWDVSPGHNQFGSYQGSSYRDVAYVRAECERLAQQLAVVKP